MFAKKTDENQKQIVLSFKKAGFKVVLLHMVGKGCPDLLISHSHLPGWSALVEIKNPKAKGRLNNLQKDFHQNWHGNIHVIETIGDVAELITEVFQGISV